MLRLALLGRPQVYIDDAPVTDFPSDKTLLLLCYLALNPTDAGHSRESLSALFWESMPPQRARANLRTTLYNLQKQFPDALLADREIIRLDPSRPGWLDVTEFQRALEQPDPEALAAAVSLYRGDFLEGMIIDDAAALEEWIHLQRERLRLQALEALERVSAYFTSGGKWEQALAATRRLLAIEPWREEAHQRLIHLLARTGQFNAALTQYETCRQILDEELGLEPMPATTALHQRIQAARARAHLHALPPQPTPLVGREAELGELFTLFNDPAQRLITLAGPGGSGKTRLAIAAAAAGAYAFRDGVIFVPLAGVTTSAGLAPAIANALGLALTGEQGVQERLLSFLRQKEMLLLLDNAEQVAAPAAELVNAILDAARAVTLLVTSRIALQAAEERLMPIAGLPVPPASFKKANGADYGDYGAVRLFDQLARRLQPQFTLAGQEEPVAELCRLLEGSPLAIELAAALAAGQSPEQLLAQVSSSFDRLATSMRDVPRRHRSLRAVFDQSWERLNQKQQDVFASLALFRGGFTQQAAAAVASASPALLADLTTHSLLRAAANDRYEIHEVLRHYAREQLESGSHADQVQQQYAAYFAGMLRAAEAALYGPDQTRTALQLRANQDNLLVAWQTAVDRGDLEMLLVTVPGLTRYCQIAGLFQVGRLTLAAAIANLPPDAPFGAQAVLHVYHAVFLAEQNEYEAALAAVQTAFDLGLETASLRGLARLQAAKVYYHQGRHAEAREQTSLALSKAPPASHLQAQCWRQLGIIQEVAGEYAEAEETLLKALHIYENNENAFDLARTSQRLGAIHFRRGDHKTARALLERTLALQREVDPTGLSSARVMVSLGTVAYNLDEPETARQYFQEVVPIFNQAGDRANEALATDMLGRMAAFAHDFSAAQQYYERALWLRQDYGYRKGAADVLRHMADLAIDMGEFERARQLLAETVETYQAIQDRRAYGTALSSLSLALHYLGRHTEAEARAREAMDVAAEVDSPLLHGYALSSLGHALRGQEKWGEAEDMYRQAHPIWQKAGTIEMAHEAQAHRLTCLLALGERKAALTLLPEIQEVLAETPVPNCDAPFALYKAAYEGLRAAGDLEQAARLLQQGRGALLELASAIGNEGQRQRYLENNPYHRFILSTL